MRSVESVRQDESTWILKSGGGIVGIVCLFSGVIMTRQMAHAATRWTRNSGIETAEKMCSSVDILRKL
jgi:hypothetical protein